MRATSVARPSKRVVPQTAAPAVKISEQSDPHAANLKIRHVAALTNDSVRTLWRRIAENALRVTRVPIRISKTGEILKTVPRFTRADVDAYLHCKNGR